MRAEDILPDAVDRSDIEGLSGREGTVAAFSAMPAPGATDAAERAKAERDMVEALPSLRAVGFFDVSVPRDARLAALLAGHPLGSPT